jgi:hypothetical protein
VSAEAWTNPAVRVRGTKRETQLSWASQEERGQEEFGQEERDQNAPDGHENACEEGGCEECSEDKQQDEQTIARAVLLAQESVPYGPSKKREARRASAATDRAGKAGDLR